MRIGIDARFFGPQETGIGRYVERLIAHLSELDQRHEFWVFLRQRAWDWWQPPSNRWHKILADHHWYGLAEQRAMPGIFRRARLDLLHVPHFNVPLFYHQPFVVTIHDLILDQFPTERATTLEPILFALKYRAYQAVVSHAIKSSQAIITVSKHSKQGLVDRFKISPDKVTVTYESFDSLPNPVPVEVLAEHGVRRPYLLHVGNSYPHKNLECLMAAVEQISNRETDFQLVLVGKRDYFSRRLESEVAKRKIPNICFYGFANDQELATLYQQATAYVFPSLSEGFGLPGLEAMAAGTPVIAARASCLPEIFGSAAEYFDPLDINDMAHSITRALHDTMLRQRLVAAGYQRLHDFSWQRMAAETLAVYDKILTHAQSDTKTKS